MNHQIYEEWALMPEYLSPEEQKALEQHQKECESCRKLAENWAAVESILISAPPAVPEPGFTARFAASLESRKAKEHKRQVRRFLLILGLILVVAMSTVSIFYYSTHSPMAIIEGLFDTGAKMITFWENIKTVARSMSRLTPTAILIPMILTTAIVVGGMTLVWVATMWKFSLTGGKVK